MDVLLLSRLQFALTIMFHYIFPPITIGLGALLVYMEGMFLKTKNPVYETMARFWTKIFSLHFAMGVATGIVMEFQFGTNWATYSRFVGDVFGSPLAAEGIFAFFLESIFLGVLVFGWDRVSPRMHFFSTVMVFLGAVLSSVWIVVANSWQQTPAGFTIVGEGLSARAEITSFWAMVFNPSSVDRLIHVWLGAFSMGAFLVMAVSAWYLLKNRHTDFAKRSLTAGLLLAVVSSWAQLGSGHRQAIVAARYQPTKMAAFEGHFVSLEGGAPLYMAGFTNTEKMKTTGIAIPNMLSLLIHGNPRTPVPALDQFPRENWPPVEISFQSYHLMVGLGFFMIGFTTLLSWLRWKNELFDNRLLLWGVVLSVMAPAVANQVGWVAAEVGRQPWIVYGLLRTSDALSPVVQSHQVMGSILMFGTIYLLMFGLYLSTLARKIQHGPEKL